MKTEFWVDLVKIWFYSLFKNLIVNCNKMSKTKLKGWFCYRASLLTKLKNNKVLTRQLKKLPGLVTDQA